MQIIWKGCAPGNYAKGRQGYRVQAITIHLMDGTLAGTDAWFRTPPDIRVPSGSPSSAHYGIGKDGTVYQWVREEDRAFHAGRISGETWPGMRRGQNGKYLNPNLMSVGIEHEGRPDDIWPEAMIHTSAELMADISSRWGFPLDRMHVCGHHEIYAPKVCPGPHCDIDKLLELANNYLQIGDKPVT